MFVNAIEKVTRFTRPILSIGRYYGSNVIHPGSATLFLINDKGWALTCRHVAQQIIAAEELQKKKSAFKNELLSRQGSGKKNRITQELEKKYGYHKKALYELYNNFVNSVDGLSTFELKLHNVYDLALIKFNDFAKLLCDDFPTFAADGTQLKQGKVLCRLGFPFPEFNNFNYDEINDKAVWTSEGRTSTPQFPIEGMVTRHLIGKSGEIFGFEVSTPGLRGQSGGPAFDAEGKIWGMQSATNHLDLNFDVNQEVSRDGEKKRITDSAFLHVGHCIGVDILKAFMREQGVEFKEA